MAVSPPRPKGPPLNALRAFEAAARHESFALAAAELCVTAGAVAQQIKHLEDWIGRELFARGVQGVRLTSKGRAALPHFTLAFDQLGAATQELRRAAAPTDFRIATLPSIAQLWLLPRLPALRAAFAELTISIVAMEQPPNLVREPYDLALFFGPTGATGLAASTLAQAHRFPVCSPMLAQRLTQPSDLSGETLLHDATWSGDWARWLQRAEVAGRGDKGPVFSLYSLALEEAKQGAGVLIGNSPLVEAALHNGELVRPFKLALTDEAPLVAETRVSALDDQATKIMNWLVKRRSRMSQKK